MPLQALCATARNLLTQRLRPGATHYQDGVSERGDQCLGSESILPGQIHFLRRDPDPDRAQQGSNQLQYAKHKQAKPKLHHQSNDSANTWQSEQGN